MKPLTLAVLCMLVAGPAWASGDVTPVEQPKAAAPIGVVKPKKVKLAEPPGKPVPIYAPQPDWIIIYTK